TSRPLSRWTSLPAGDHNRNHARLLQGLSLITSRLRNSKMRGNNCTTNIVNTDQDYRTSKAYLSPSHRTFKLTASRPNRDLSSSSRTTSGRRCGGAPSQSGMSLTYHKTHDFSQPSTLTNGIASFVGRRAND